MTETLSVSVNGTYYPGQGVDGFSEVSVNVPQSVTGYTEKEITERKYNIVNLNNSASFVGVYAFYGNDTIQTVNLPECSNVKMAAFSSCTNLTSVDLPKCDFIESSAFQNCSSLTYISLPMCSTVRSNAFEQCTQITEISLPCVGYLYNYTFRGCTSLTSLTVCLENYVIPNYGTQILQNTKIIAGNGNIYVASDVYSRFIATTGWSSLAAYVVSVNQSGPVLSYDSGVISGITKYADSKFSTYLGISLSDVLTVNLPDCMYVASSAFQNCTALSQVYLPKCSWIGNLAFYVWNGVSMSLILGYSDVVVAGGAQIIDGGGNTLVYVPASLVDAYKSAQYWSNYSSLIFPIPEP